jgi:hypothetical protein
MDVDLFFVLPGFRIGSLILAEHQPHFFGSFYSHRVSIVVPYGRAPHRQLRTRVPRLLHSVGLSVCNPSASLNVTVSITTVTQGTWAAGSCNCGRLFSRLSEDVMKSGPPGRLESRFINDADRLLDSTAEGRLGRRPTDSAQAENFQLSLRSSRNPAALGKFDLKPCRLSRP